MMRSCNNGTSKYKTIEEQILLSLLILLRTNSTLAWVFSYGKQGICTAVKHRDVIHIKLLVTLTVLINVAGVLPKICTTI